MMVKDNVIELYMSKVPFFTIRNSKQRKNVIRGIEWRAQYSE